MKPSGWKIGVLAAAVFSLLAASGCTGTDLLNTGNQSVRWDVQFSNLDGADIDWTCILFEFEEMRVRPLDGTCGADSPVGLVGAPCFENRDCRSGPVQGTCEGSLADELVPSGGILVIDPDETERGNALGGPCENDFDLGSFRNNLLAVDEFQPTQPAILTAGLYEIDDFVLNNIVLFRNGATSTDLRWCLDGISPVEFLPEDSLRFFVQPGEEKVVLFDFDVDTLEDLLEFNDCFEVEDFMPTTFTCVTCDGAP